MRTRPFMLSLILGFSGLALASLHVEAGELYKWTDENGKIQYTQFPPKDRPYTTMNITGVKAPAAAEAPERPAASDTETPEGKAAAGENGKTKGEKAKDQSSQFLAAKRSNCETAQKNLSTLTSKTRVSIKDKDGQPRLMTDQERADQLKLAQEQVKTYCQ
ncbi:MAG: DUF4124 domain-containing protein [Gammaproteobacteria bacterium]|nr:DUF4124 domain-containing protein [Gammaproteobacteria bacterium]